MIVYIILTMVTVMIAAFVRKQDNAVGEAEVNRQRVCNMVCLSGVFTLLFLVSACRYQVGNDYGRYEEFFHLIPLGEVVPTEFGFNWIVLLMQGVFGRETKLSIFALFAFFTVLFMLKAIYDQSRHFLFSFFLFMTLSYYFQSLNTVRYYFAWAVAVFSMKYVLKKQYVRFLILILLTASVHKSVLLVIPVYLLSNLEWKKWFYALMIAFAASGFVLKDLYMKVIIRLYPSYEHTDYLDGGTSLINILRIVGVLALTLLYYRQAIQGQKQNRFYFHLNLFALLLYTGGFFLPEISRIGYYMTAGHIFLLPSVLEQIDQEKQRRFFTVVTVTAAILYFVVFLNKAQDLLVRIVPYHTWIFPGELSGKGSL